ncbi:hypothetical protein M758_1G114800 [Ceratodon purpureus]|nr:hypothetical protein M758_1G114800 [Ceratodon purpureus]
MIVRLLSIAHFIIVRISKLGVVLLEGWPSHMVTTTSASQLNIVDYRFSQLFCSFASCQLDIS